MIISISSRTLSSTSLIAATAWAGSAATIASARSRCGGTERRLAGALQRFIQLVQDLAEHRVARRLVDGAMERRIGLMPVAARRDLDQQDVAEPRDLRPLRRGGVDRGLAHHLVLERPAHLDQAKQCLALEADHRRREPTRGPHLGREIRAVAAPAADDPEAFPAVQRLADGGAADAERGGERDFRRQPVAHVQSGPLDHFGKRVQHGDAARPRLQRFEVAQYSVLSHACSSRPKMAVPAPPSQFDGFVSRADVPAPSRP